MRSIVRCAVPSRRRWAKFWFLTGARTYNPIVRQVVLAKQMNLLDCARIYALTSMAAADSFIAVFEAKYHYNFWRPVTAIRNADLSQNPATPRDASWQPLGETPDASRVSVCTLHQRVGRGRRVARGGGR